MSNPIVGDRQGSQSKSPCRLFNDSSINHGVDPAKRPVQFFSRRSLLTTHSESLWLLQSGVVRTLTYLEDGSIVTLGIWTMGEWVGKPLSQIRPYLIEALTAVEVIPMPIQEWQPTSDLLFNYFQQAENLMLIRANRRVEEALLAVLNWLADKFGRQVAEGLLIDLKLTHQDLAELTGTTRVTITRLLRQLEDQGRIYRQSRQLILAHHQEHWHYEI